MKAGIYARVSTADQADGFSIAAQLRAVRAHCAAQGWQVAEEYIDEGLSAAKESAAHRPAFRKLLADVEAGSLDVVVVHKLDRFSRNLTVTIQSLARINAAGATFVSLNEHIDYTTPQGRLMLSVFGAFAQFYSDNLATEVAKGRGERAKQGLWNGDLPFGYVSTGDPRQVPVVVPAEAALVAGAFKLYAGGTLSAHEVAMWLNDQGASPRSKRGLTKFTKATVLDMLGNPFYCGRVRYRGAVLPGRHEPIVEEQLFEAVARTRTARRKLTSAVRERHARSWLLRGLARCTSCGGVLWCHPAAAGDRYRDASKLKQRPCGAAMTSVSAPTIDDQIGQLISRMVLPDSWREKAIQYVEAAGDGPDRSAKRQRLKDRMGRLREVYLDGDMPRGQYQAERSRLQAELEELDAMPLGDEGLEAASQLMGRLAALWSSANDEERAALVQSVFAEVWVDLDARRVEWLKPRPQFRVLFDVLRDEKVVSGDPDRIRVNHAQLYVPLLTLVDMGDVYAPGELVVA